MASATPTPTDSSSQGSQYSQVGPERQHGDDAKLHALCHSGKLKDIVEFVGNMEVSSLSEKLSNRKGVFGYTPLHEAVAGGKTQVLDFLLDKVKDTPAMMPINCKANSGYTPLHLAASSGHHECVRILINRGANISITDEYGKTPKQTAELSSKSKIVQLLRSEEIIKEVEHDGNNLAQLLKAGTDRLEPNCINRALKAATRNDNHQNIAKLIVKNPTNLEECLEIARVEKKPYSRASLLLIVAALTNNIAIVQTLFGTGEVVRGFPLKHRDEGLDDVRKAISSREITTVVSLDLARKYRNFAVQEELLMQTDVHQITGIVRWGGLGLIEMKTKWLQNIYWVRTLRLGKNGLKHLPEDMTALSQATDIDLGHNDLSEIPKSLLELPCLEKLNLSSNKLNKIPEVRDWSMCLKTLDLSHNLLYTLPSTIMAPALQYLNISHNRFRYIPQSICSVSSLTQLDLSDNPDILTLPPEMGRLKKLRTLKLQNLKDLNDPPKSLHADAVYCLRYLKLKLRGDKEFYRMKLMLVGNANRGKTTLVARLHGKQCRNEATVGINISEWDYTLKLFGKTFYFSIWDFGGQEEYYTTHQCFLSQNSLYLLLFNLTHGEEGIREIVPWLNNIAVKAPNSKVIIVGTHLDQIPEPERERLDNLYRKVKELVVPYTSQGTLQVFDEVVPVGLKHSIENVLHLKQVIYQQAENYKIGADLFIMGRKIPTSYHALDTKLQGIQREVRRGTHPPVMHATDFIRMVEQMNLADICDEEDLETAVLFLMDVGSLLHYDDRGHSLHELYFVDPRWLCDMMSKVVTVKERNPFIKRGILHSKDIPILYKDKQFPWAYYEQYIALLDRFEIALPLDNKRILIPSMLPEQRPLDLFFEDRQPLYTRYFKFESASTPPGFWSRLLSRIMHTVTKVRYALDKSIPLSTSPLSPVSPEMPESPINESISSGMFKVLTSFFQPQVSRPLHHVKACPPVIAPEQLPNYPKSLPLDASHFEAESIQLKYWRKGLYYRDPEVLFCIESLAGSGKYDQDGIVVTASSNKIGIIIVCQLIDIIDSLLKEWYPGMKPNSIKQHVECPECVKQGRGNPFLFDCNDCLSNISKSKLTMECAYRKDDPLKNHSVPLKDIVPDLLLQDIDPKFLLDVDKIHCTDEPLGEGGYGEVYKGELKSEDRKKEVAIKKFTSRKSKREKLYELTKEARLLCGLHHPCLISLEGVCTHPDMMALVLELAPKNSVTFTLLKQNNPVERVTIFRIAAQVASALRFLHSKSIIFRDLKADNVLLWTTDLNSLCHCKVTDFGIATYVAPVGARGLVGSSGFKAPEVLHFCKYLKGHSVYSYKADVFSFGMFLFQLIARKIPFENKHADVSVADGDRPKVHEVKEARNSFHYLTQLMQLCWKHDPNQRPETDQIIESLCLCEMQVVKCVFPIKCNIILTVRQSVAVIKHSKDRREDHKIEEKHSQLWVCGLGYRGDSIGTEIIFINTYSLVHHPFFLKEKYVQCMVQCNDHVWMGTRTDTDGTIEIFKTKAHEHVHSVKLRGSSVTCMTSYQKAVYLGTIEGFCFRFKLNELKDPKIMKMSEHAINNMVCISSQNDQEPAILWVSNGKKIHFLCPDTLSHQGTAEQTRDSDVGQLSASPEFCRVWSVHLGSTIFTAWDTTSRSQLFEVNIEPHLAGITTFGSKKDMAITAMIPALDTVWVGTASGHILVFHDRQLLMRFRPYTEYVRFLTCIPSNSEDRCTVASEGKNFKSLVEQLEASHIMKQHNGASTDKAGTVVFWEAHLAKTIKQINLVEGNAPGLYDDDRKVQELIRRGDFNDNSNAAQDVFDPSRSCKLLPTNSISTDENSEATSQQHSYSDDDVSSHLKKTSQTRTSQYSGFPTDQSSSAATSQPTTPLNVGSAVTPT